jgi:hypothetical protein
MPIFLIKSSRSYVVTINGPLYVIGRKSHPLMMSPKFSKSRQDKPNKKLKCTEPRSTSDGQKVKIIMWRVIFNEIF